MRRFARVGGEVGWLAAQLAGSRVLGTTLDKGRHSQQLKAALGGLKGPLMKAAQILATVPEALPREYAEELRQLQSNAPPMGWPFVRRRMRTELGAGWEQRFDSFGREAAAAASLGQVHKAEAGGRTLACKLQYPDMASAVEADVQQLRLAFSVYRQYDRAIDTSEIYAELTARLREELDYEREAQHMALYRLMLAGETGVTVPEPVAELTTRRLLTMTWLEGRPLLEVAQELSGSQGQERRDAIALNMFRAWYVPFYYHGVIHGDPHLGNYSVRPDDGVNLLDFGCIRVFRPDFVEGVIDLYRAFETDDEALAIKAYESWGFAGIADKPDLMQALNIWARFLYKPLLEDRVQSIMGERGSMEGAEAAGQVHKELRRLGGVKPPREFVLMDRAAIGLGSVFLHLKAEINWHRVFQELIAGFDAAALGRRQKQALKQVGLAEEIP
ncbi:MAG: AarF/UbiB family protein [Tistlia sp.]|uniref:ABC1 kinase family protein n=1 Tax=Tistlia sp. TaxID=3057121 RepID=UPI0034A4D068